MNLLKSDLLEHNTGIIIDAFSCFLQKEAKYKNQYLQCNYKNAFDGYSFIGQKDSLNQYDYDMLHSFVLSDFHAIKEFPVEFQPFLINEWPKLISKVKEHELKIIEKYQLPFEELYKEDKMGYMMSCNYYPKPKEIGIRNNNQLRLSTHPDVSLFTTFPYGIKEGLSYFQNEETIELKEQTKTISFLGYFAEFFSNKKNFALEHQVELPTDFSSERFSFAVFSIPKPTSNFIINQKETSGKEYYDKYLSIF